MTQRWMVNICPFLHFDNSRIQTYEHNISIASWNVKSVLDYLEVHAEHKFILDQSTLLEGFKKLFPNYWDALHQRVLEGRIEIVGGTYVMPDFIIPDGESIARQFVFGKKFNHGELGINVRVGWAIDSAGHCAQMPQILRLCGIDSYVFWRGMPYDGPSEFVWKGPDGSRVNAIWLSRGFDSAAWLSENTREAFSRLLRLVEETGEISVSKNVFLPVGGELVPPLPHLNDIVDQWNKTFPDMRITIATAGEYADKLKSVQATMPTITGPLLSGRFTGMRSGGLSTRPQLKLMNRKLETLLYLCELYLSLSGASLKSFEIDNIWRILLFNQDHNIIRGTITNEPYKLAKLRFEQAIEQAEQILEGAIGNCSASVKHDSDVVSFVIYNPVSWIRTDIVKVVVDSTKLSQKFFEINDPDGNSIPYQIVSESNSEPIEIVFIAKDMPSLGHRVYSIISVEKQPKFDTSLKHGRNWVESSDFILEFDEFNGSFLRLYDKKNQAEYINKAAHYLLLETDVGDLYRYSKPEFAGDKTGLSTLRYPAELKNIESGPIRCVFKVQCDFEGSSRTEIVTVYNKIHRLDIEMTLNYRSRDKRIRLNIPLTILADEVQVGAQFGCETRATSSLCNESWNEKSGAIFPALDWIDCSGSEFGICFSAPGLHEFEFQDGILKATLLRSVDYLSRGQDDDIIETRSAREKGEHTFRYMLYPHDHECQMADAWQVSAEHRLPLIAYPLDNAPGGVESEVSYLKIEGLDLMLSCYRPIDDDEFVIRLYEPKGTSGSTKITFHRDLAKVTMVDILERDIGELGFEGRSVEFPIDAYSIITLNVVFKQH
ncbi:MAG: hypothetical protein JW779_13755 [Candidatus Thorarchaeota archaeon]|nr:hypothetical protein [Candidatus Thorarchaeota archaeon]